jgi:tRNA A37 threonylcarbamoyladenosine synthetase subunit TsaC/SUA5/YrdC
MPTTLTAAPATTAKPPRRLVLTDPADVQHAVDALANGGVVGHGFANGYAMTTRPDAEIVRRVNRMKGRPADQVGSITVPPEHIPELYDWTQLPPGLTRRSVLRVMDAFYDSGPFGFRGPAADHIPPHLTYLKGYVVTAQVMAPGYNCPSNDFLARALAVAHHEVLTSPRRTRTRTAPASRCSSIPTRTPLGPDIPTTSRCRRRLSAFIGR